MARIDSSLASVAVGHVLQAAADGQRPLGKVERFRLLGHAGDSGLGTHALGQHQGVVDRFEVGVGLAKQRGGLVRLAELQVGLGKQVAKLAEPVSGRAEVQQLLA